MHPTASGVPYVQCSVFYQTLRAAWCEFRRRHSHGLVLPIFPPRRPWPDSSFCTAPQDDAVLYALVSTPRCPPLPPQFGTPHPIGIPSSWELSVEAATVLLCPPAWPHPPGALPAVPQRSASTLTVLQCQMPSAPQPHPSPLTEPRAGSPPCKAQMHATTVLP